jgi:hypothetical protein
MGIFYVSIMLFSCFQISGDLAMHSFVFHRSTYQVCIPFYYASISYGLALCIPFYCASISYGLALYSSLGVGVGLAVFYPNRRTMVSGYTS